MKLEDEFWSAAHNGQLDKIKSCLARGININLAVRGDYVLNVTVEKSYIAAVHLLLENGANPNVVDNRNCTPLHFAVSNGNPAMVTLLLQHGADRAAKTLSGHTPLDFAIMHNKLPVARALMPRHTAKEWKLQSADDIVNVRYLPDIGQKRTEAFSFRDRLWTLTIQNALEQYEGSVVKFFDEMTDKSLIEEAVGVFRSLGGTVDDDVIHGRRLRNKQPLIAPKPPSSRAAS